MTITRGAFALFALLLLAGCSERPVDTTDQSTPQAAVKAFLHVVELRDAAAVERFFVTEDEAQKQYAAAYVELLSASARLRDAAASAFGREESRQIVGGWIPGSDEARRIDTATVAIEGEIATVTTATGDALRLRQVDGKWCIVPSVRSGETDLAAAAGTLSRLAQAMASTADDIASGKLTTVEAAKRQLLNAAGMPAGA